MDLTEVNVYGFNGFNLIWIQLDMDPTGYGSNWIWIQLDMNFVKHFLNWFK